jgi:hypothetical protein
MKFLSEAENLERLTQKVLSKRFSENVCQEFERNLSAITQRSSDGIGYNTQIATEIRSSLQGAILQFQQHKLRSDFQQTTGHIDRLLAPTKRLFEAFGGEIKTLPPAENVEELTR